MSLEKASKQLQDAHDEAVKLVDKWFPNLQTKPRDYRITITATMNHLVKLMELQSPQW